MIGPTTESDADANPSKRYINVLRKIETEKKEREFSLRERGGDKYSDGIRLLALSVWAHFMISVDSFVYVLDQRLCYLGPAIHE